MDCSATHTHGFADHETMGIYYSYHLADLLMAAVFRHAVASAATSQIRPDPVGGDNPTSVLGDRNRRAVKRPIKLKSSMVRVPS